MIKPTTNVYCKIASLAFGKAELEVESAEESQVYAAVQQTLHAEDPDIDVLLHYLSGVPPEIVPEIRELLYCILRQDLTETGSKFQHGTYKHFKGHQYRTLMCAKDAISEKDLVVYTALQDGSLWTRPTLDFGEVVLWPDGRYRSRFVKV